jgi:hypothetical protein
MVLESWSQASERACRLNLLPEAPVPCSRVEHTSPTVVMGTCRATSPSIVSGPGLNLLRTHSEVVVVVMFVDGVTGTR